MVIYIPEGDIFKIEGVNCYAHGCNCVGAMGAGIALVFKQKYPKMYSTYRYLCSVNKFMPGGLYAYPLNSKGDYVFNLGTQASWRTGAKITYIRESLEKMVSFSLKNNVHKIAMPAIGAGLGGLQWDDVKMVINEVAASIPEEMLTVFVVETFNTHG